MSLLPFFTWLDGSSVAQAIRDSSWLFPAIESVHLAGLALLGGAVLLVDLRLLGLGLNTRPVRELAGAARPWLATGLALMLPTGFLLLSSEALRCYENTAFWVKMTSLSLALVFTFTIRQHVTAADEARRSPLMNRTVATISLLLWAGVGWGGRWIGFS